jgi:hypothetical protein
MYRASVLRALSMGMRFLWTSSEAVALDPAVTRFFNATAGLSPEQANDAWCYLREAKVKKGPRKLVLKNFERWLEQREIDGYRTRPAEFVVRKAEHYDVDQPGEFSARSTDRAAGNSRIGFRVAGAFGRRASGAKTLRVTYVDHGATFHLLYSTASSVDSSAEVRGQNDGVEKTALFMMRGFEARRALDGSFDLALVADSGDLVASFVRLSR